MLTEEEAKTKWCFQRGRIGSPDKRALSPGNCCIGPACMAWRQRWRDEFGSLWHDRNHAAATAVLESVGFCGLAGDNP